MLYPVILAGGSGTRLWPISTKNNPKQLNALLAESTLLQATYKRLLNGFDQSEIFLVPSEDLVPEIKKQLKIKDDHILAEPQRRNTAAAVGLAALHLSLVDEQAVMVTVNSDAYVKQAEEYVKIIKFAGETVAKSPDKFILLGIKPLYPETGYGYIQLSPEAALSDGDYPILSVKKFKEKPDLETAKQYLADGDYLWNPAIFVFSAQQLLRWYEQYVPEIYQGLMRIKAAWLSGDPQHYQQVLAAEYETMPNISIDYALLEKLPEMWVIPADIIWADIGHWRSLRDVQLAKHGQSNVVRGQHVAIDSERNLLYAENKLIATIGIKDMILVVTDKVVLLCPADRAHEVKELIKQLADEGLSEFL